MYEYYLNSSKLEYSSVVWNNVTWADSNKVENIQRNLENFRYSRFIQFNFPVIMIHVFIV
jgi:hypothetical protein